MTRLQLALVAVLCLAGEATAPMALAKPALSDDVVAAISVFQKDPTSKEGFAAAEKVTSFAKTSDKIHLSLSKAVVPWMKTGDVEDADTRGILLNAYIVGNVEAQLKSGKSQDDVYAGWQEVLAIYAHLLSINPVAKIPEVEELKHREEAGTLRGYATEAQGH